MELEKILSNNVEAFNADEPTDDHFEKFRKKLQDSEDYKENKIYPAIHKMAVVLIIIIMSAGMLYVLNSKSKSYKINGISHISYELYEVEMYYKSQINNKYKKIRDLDFNNDETEKTRILSELKDMDSAYTELLEDLNQNPCDGRVVNAIIGYYQVKSEFMDRIIIQAKKNKI